MLPRRDFIIRRARGPYQGSRSGRCGTTLLSGTRFILRNDKSLIRCVLFTLVVRFIKLVVFRIIWCGDMSRILARVVTASSVPGLRNLPRMFACSVVGSKSTFAAILSFSCSYMMIFFTAVPTTRISCDHKLQGGCTVQKLLSLMTRIKLSELLFRILIFCLRSQPVFCSRHTAHTVTRLFLDLTPESVAPTADLPVRGVTTC